MAAERSEAASGVKLFHYGRVDLRQLWRNPGMILRLRFLFA
jgi:hypothetical protein